MSKQSSLDKQVGGDHYKKYEYQPMQFAEDVGLSPMIFSALKYICRHKDKGKPVEDLRKAIHCIDMFVEHGKYVDYNGFTDKIDIFSKQFDDKIRDLIFCLFVLYEDITFANFTKNKIRLLIKEYE